MTEDKDLALLEEIAIGLRILNEAFLFSEAHRTGLMPDECYHRMLRAVIDNMAPAEEMKPYMEPLN